GVRTQSIVSAPPGGLARSSSRSRLTALTTLRVSASETPGARTSTISTSRSAGGYPIQWYRQRRFSASCSSRVRLEVSTTTGGLSALIVPVFGMVVFQLERDSSESA